MTAIISFKLGKLFNYIYLKVFDVNNDGYISADELKSVMKCLGEELSQDELEAMIDEADMDKDGLVNFEGK